MSDRLVVLGPGWTNVKSSWIAMQGKFNKEGFDTIVSPYGDGRGFGPIENHAEKLAKLLKSVNKYYEHITYIGHSMGGLVGRYVIQKLDEGQYIDSYVSLGSPHHGSMFSFMAPWSQSAKQMMINSDFLNDLNSTPWPDIPALSIRGAWDMVVLPSWCSHFAHGENIILPNTTHLSLIFNPRTFLEVWNWLIFEVLNVDLKDNDLGLSSKAS